MPDYRFQRILIFTVSSAALLVSMGSTGNKPTATVGSFMGINIHKHMPVLALAVSLLLCPAVLAQNTQTKVAETEAPNHFSQPQFEILMDEGRTLLENNLFTEAEKVFAEAVQNIKINYGLDSPFQLPAVNLLGKALIAQGSWAALDRQLAYFEWINDSNYNKDIEVYLRWTEVLSRLYLAAAADINNSANAHYLVTAKNLNWRAVSAIESTFGEQSLRLAPWLYNIVLIHYYQSSISNRRFLTSYTYKSESSEIVSGWALGKSESLQKSYGIGKELLQRIRVLYRNSNLANAESDAVNLIYRADWDVLFGKSRSALNLYNRAYVALLTTGLSTQELDGFFSRAKVLPEQSLEVDWYELNDSAQAANSTNPLSFTAWSPVFPATELPEKELPGLTSRRRNGSALFRFDLVPQHRNSTEVAGVNLQPDMKAENFQFLSSSPDWESLETQVQKEISQLHFRPRLQNGRVMTNTTIEMDYSFYLEEGPSLVNELR